MRGDYYRGTEGLAERIWQADEKFTRETKKRDRNEECRDDRELGEEPCPK